MTCHFSSDRDDQCMSSFKILNNCIVVDPSSEDPIAHPLQQNQDGSHDNHTLSISKQYPDHSSIKYILTKSILVT